MENKYSLETQAEIENILKEIHFKKSFFVKYEFFFDGWAIFLKEKTIYPRLIVIFKSYIKNSFSIKSFEIQNNNYNKEKYNQLYFVEKIKNPEELIKELNAIIYGKDIMNYTSKKYHEYFEK
ncbi:MAG: hypothetical protein ACFFAT_21820 [Promethearchaeota archaeon]